MGTARILPHCGLFRQGTEESEQEADEVENGLCGGIQECLETVRDLRANNAQAEYMEGLESKIRAVEKHHW